ncbi:MAG TPA: MBL fold metallo-hydrolase [Gammaproteobacteria bacterium]|jgi:phosphoribosyl 1,2-cyclic phosphodiesterase
MRFCLLGSGSRGNATLVEEGDTRLLVDCGFSLREVERRMARLGTAPDRLSAILVTHEHHDHLAGVGALSRKYRIPVWLSAGTGAAGLKRLGELPRRSLLNCHSDFAIDGLHLHPFPVPHDAREPCQFIFSNGDQRLGLLTDTGRSTQHIEQQLDGCDALILESNHDLQMLANGPYPPALQARVGGGQGHLSNEQAAGILQRIDCSSLQHLVAAHLSEKNNRPDLAVEALSGALGCEREWIALADQDHGLGWREIL